MKIHFEDQGQCSTLERCEAAAATTAAAKYGTGSAIDARELSGKWAAKEFGRGHQSCRSSYRNFNKVVALHLK